MVRYFPRVFEQSLVKLLINIIVIRVSHLIHNRVGQHTERCLKFANRVTLGHLGQHFKAEALALVISVEVIEGDRVQDLDCRLIEDRVVVPSTRCCEKTFFDDPLSEIIQLC